MCKKYKIRHDISINYCDKTLYKIEALIGFGNVETGDLGGYIESERNLSQDGTCWVYDDAMVYNNACVSGNASVYHNARVFNNASVCEDAMIYNNACICGSAAVYGKARVCDDALVSGNTYVYDNAVVACNACVEGYAVVRGNSLITGNALVSGNTAVYGDTKICRNALLSSDADYAYIKGFGRFFRQSTFFKCKDKSIKVVCGCFVGTISEFRAKVKATHGNSKIAKEYLAIADLMELHFGKEE